jgi:glyoxylase-like metal-dependent hydrolase (beta-lactamase superfamily II)
MGRVEFEHWSRPHGREDMVAVFGDSVQPVFDAGLIDLVEMDARLSDEISLIPTVGHTPGHVSVRILSRGQEALITGDFMHHPCQIAHPEWASTADSDAAQGQRTRERMFAELAGAPVLVIGTHFAGATAGRIVRDDGAYRLDV